MRGLDPRDAALTGTGWLAGLGGSTSAIWTRLVAGARAVAAVESDDVRDGRRLAVPVEKPWQRAPVPAEQESQVKFLNAAGELASSVAHEALNEAGLLGGRLAPERCGLFLAQTDFSRTGTHDFRPAVVEATDGLERPVVDAPRLNAASLTKVYPFVLLETLHNNAVSFLAASFGLRGANSSLAGNEGTGLQAAMLAARAVRHGRVDAALAVGSGHASGGVVRHELWRLGALTRAFDPAAAPRPFDRARDGTVVGDGAGALALEPLAVARERSSGPHVVVVGSGSATGGPPDGALGPDAETLSVAMRAALRDAGLRVPELGGVVASGSGRRLEDAALLAALKDVLGTHPAPVASAVGALGHAAAGTDAAHLILAARALAEGLLPLTAGFREGEPGCESVAVTRASTPLLAPSVLVVGTGLDGQALALLLARAR
jgi:3-oxoacyl-(acyl-carrier-protein) synthase